jgi:hypothetical protein
MSDRDDSRSDRQEPGTRDPLTVVRDHPAWFFRRATFDPDEAVSLLIREATLAGANSVRVAEHDDWVAVAADIDWLRGDLAAFRRLARYADGGRNSARIETAIAAFCPGLATRAGAEGVQFLKATGRRDRGVRKLMRRLPAAGRVVAFLSPPHNDGSVQEISDHAYESFDIARVIDSYLEKV